MREIIESKSLPRPQFKYSSLIKAGPFYFTSGMIALDLSSGSLVSGGPESETKHILSVLSQSLSDLKLSFNHLVSAKIYTTKFDQFDLINKAWEEFFKDIKPPVRTSIGVSSLPLGASVEMEFVLYNKD